MDKRKNFDKTFDLVILALFVAIVAVVGMTPVGFLPGPIARFALTQIPVIIGSITLGPKKGAVLGFIFGLTSFLSNFYSGSFLAFAFNPFVSFISGPEKWLALVICFVPRTCVGILPFYVCKGIEALAKKLFRKTNKISTFLAYIVAAFSGTFIANTLFVMSLVYIIFKEPFAQAKEIAVDAVFGAVLAVITGNGITEAVITVIIVPPVCLALGKIIAKYGIKKTALKNNSEKTNVPLSADEIEI